MAPVQRFDHDGIERKPLSAACTCAAQLTSPLRRTSQGCHPGPVPGNGTGFFVRFGRETK